MFDARAFYFRSPLKLAAIKDKLNELGPWKWFDRDNDNYGEYIATPYVLDDSTMKLFVEDDGRYRVQVVLRTQNETDAMRAEFGAVHARYQSEILPALKASEITEAPLD